MGFFDEVFGLDGGKDPDKATKEGNGGEEPRDGEVW